MGHQGTLAWLEAVVQVAAAVRVAREVKAVGEEAEAVAGAVEEVMAKLVASTAEMVETAALAVKAVEVVEAWRVAVRVVVAAADGWVVVSEGVGAMAAHKLARRRCMPRGMSIPGGRFVLVC